MDTVDDWYRSIYDIYDQDDTILGCTVSYRKPSIRYNTVTSVSITNPSFPGGFPGALVDESVGDVERWEGVYSQVCLRITLQTENVQSWKKKRPKYFFKIQHSRWNWKFLSQRAQGFIVSTHTNQKCNKKVPWTYWSRWHLYLSFLSLVGKAITSSCTPMLLVDSIRHTDSLGGLWRLIVGLSIHEKGYYSVLYHYLGAPISSLNEELSISNIKCFFTSSCWSVLDKKKPNFGIARYHIRCKRKFHLFLAIYCFVNFESCFFATVSRGRDDNQCSPWDRNLGNLLHRSLIGFYLSHMLKFTYAFRSVKQVRIKTS